MHLHRQLQAAFIAPLQEQWAVCTLQATDWSQNNRSDAQRRLQLHRGWMHRKLNVALLQILCQTTGDNCT